MLTQRIVTAIILGLSIVLAIFYLSPIGFDLLSLLIVALAVCEYSELFINWNYQIRLGFLLLFLVMVMSIQSIAVIPVLMIGVLWWLIAPYVLWRYVENGYNYFANLISQLVLGTLIFVPCWLGLVVIKERFGTGFLFYLLAIVCAADIGAYFAGRFFGKHLLAPKISPKKTFEGLWGGILASLLVAISGILLLKSEASITSNISFLMLSVVVSLWSTIGDLFESMLKRQAGVKDSGKLLPGHGGIYDRIDSLTAAVPIFALGMLLI